MKLNQDEKILVCNLIAQYKKPKQIQILLDDEHDIKLKLNTIRKFNETDKELIGKLREHYLSTVSEVPIAQKRIRLEREEALYETADEIDEVKDKIDTKLKCLASAREEVEGRGGQTVTFAQYNQYNQLSDEELQQKIKEIELKIARTKIVEVENVSVK